MLGVSLTKGGTGRKDTQNFKKKYGLTYPLAIETQAFMASYKDKTPYSHFYLLVDRKGIVQECLSTHDSDSLPHIEKRLANIFSSGLR